MKSRSWYRNQVRWSWAQSLSNVLSCRDGRAMLRRYFDGLSYENDNKYTLDLWEMIDDFQNERMKGLPRNEEKYRLNLIYKHAVRYVNFDAHQLRILKPLQTGTERDEEDELLKQAKVSAEELLGVDQQGFSEWIIQNSPTL